MFEGFVDERVDVGEVELRVRHAGDGRPVLLIHGHPRTGSTWHRVTPRLLDSGFTVVCPDKPERAILADPDAWYGGDPDAMGAESYAEFREAIHDPATVTAMLEDYRAGLGVDRQHEEADRRAGHTVRCPTLLLWSTRDDLERLYGDPAAIWRRWTGELQSASIDSGHHVAEEPGGTRRRADPVPVSGLILDSPRRGESRCFR